MAGVGNTPAMESLHQLITEHPRKSAELTKNGSTTCTVAPERVKLLEQQVKEFKAKLKTTVGGRDTTFSSESIKHVMDVNILKGQEFSNILKKQLRHLDR